MKQFRDQFSTGYTDTIDGQDNQPDFTAGQKALIVSILSAGTFFGALFAAPVADKVGRRYGLMVSCLVFIVGALLQVAASTIPVFAVGRCVAGLGVGMLSTLVPLYQAETSVYHSISWSSEYAVYIVIDDHYLKHLRVT